MPTDSEAAQAIRFSGNPVLYRKVSILISLYLVVSVYGTFALIKYLLHDETWVFGWQPLLFVMVFGVGFARFCYRWIMRLDARYGSGRSWQLVSTRVKLPELRRHH